MVDVREDELGNKYQFIMLATRYREFRHSLRRIYELVMSGKQEEK